MSKYLIIFQIRGNLFLVLLIDKRHRDGGDRAKATTPSHLAEDAWIGCGDCGKTDSQNHWIREFPAAHTF